MIPDIKVILFSRDRAMQLDACLRSLYARCADASRLAIDVIYTASSPGHKDTYEELIRHYDNISFVRETHFRYDVLTALSGSEYAFFLVDDTVFFRDFAVSDAVAMLVGHDDTIGFSFRLGKNTTYNYPFDKPQTCPEFTANGDDVLRFDWTTGDLDFNYPLELSSSLYRARDIMPLLRSLRFKHPNELESVLDDRKSFFAAARPYLACYRSSVAVSVPANISQPLSRNRAGSLALFSLDRLRSAFAAGRRISIDSFEGFSPNACHQEFPFVFDDVRKIDPKVSIIIVNYNYGRFLADTIESALSQTYRNFEIIVVDNASTDTSLDIARRYIDPSGEIPIRLIASSENLGHTAARRLAISQSSAKYLLPLDSDDKLSHRYLEKTVAALEDNPKAGYAYVDAMTFGRMNLLNFQDEYSFERHARENFFAYCSLIRRRAYNEAGGYDPENWGYYEDWDLSLSLGERLWFPVHVKEFLFYYRKHSSLSDTYTAFHIHCVSYLRLRHPRLYSSEELDEARQRLHTMPEGWNRQPLTRSVPEIVALIRHNHPDNSHWIEELADVLQREGQQQSAEAMLEDLRESLGPSYASVSECCRAKLSPGSDSQSRNKTTVFMLTIGDPSVAACYRSIRNQSSMDFDFAIIPGVRPFSTAMQAMIDQCTTPYFIQVDEDMILRRDAVLRMQTVMEQAPEHLGMICFLLYDKDLRTTIHGVKIWRTAACTSIKIRSSLDADMEPLDQLGDHGYHWIVFPEVAGFHGTTYTPATIYQRYKTMYQNSILTWNLLSPAMPNAVRRFRRTGDVRDLFAILGSAHGVMDAGAARAGELRDYSKYGSDALSAFSRLLLAERSAFIEYDPARPSPSFRYPPQAFEDVRWKSPIRISNAMRYNDHVRRIANAISKRVRKCYAVLRYYQRLIPGNTRFPISNASISPVRRASDNDSRASEASP